ncbi:MAG TPA: DUF2723 domain-containing protein [Candidatus Saccharimonadales bacterium]|nr:DUF2723 domain-containing protein [Candidatus Saccharimonadales bacterium]
MRTSAPGHSPRLTLDRPSLPLAIGAGAIGLIAFGLAWATLLPGLGFWDTGEFQTVAPLLGTAHPTGFPSYVILGWLASIVLQPFGDPAWRMNLLSAFLGAGASALSVVLVYQLTRRLWLAIVSGAIFAAIPIVWAISNHADPHALHLFMVAVLLVLLVGWERRAVARSSRSDRWLVAAAVAFAIALGNHTLTVLLAPGIGLFVLAVAPDLLLRRPRFVAGVFGLTALVTGLLYLELPIRAGLFRAPLVYGHPETLGGFAYVVLGQQFQGAFTGPLDDLPGKVAALAQLGFDQLGPLVFLVPLGFMMTVARRPRYALLTGVGFVITTAFAATYINADINRYYLGPALMAVTWIAILAGWFVEQLWRVFGVIGAASAPNDAAAGLLADAALGPRGRPSASARQLDGRPAGAPAGAARRLGGPSGVVLVAVILELAVSASLLTPSLTALGDRRAMVDLSDQTTASAWANTAMALFAPNAVVISWWSYSTTLWYAQLIEHQRPDVWIVDDRTRLDENLGDVSDVIDAQLGHRPVYLVRINADELAALNARYQLATIPMPTEQSILRVIGRRGQ